MNGNNRLILKIVSVVLVYASGLSSACALGFRNPDQGAAATAQGEAFIAQADDATAVYYNPAGMTQLEGAHFTLGAYVFAPRFKYQGAAGSDTMNTATISPHLYWASDLGRERLRMGLAVNAPYGTKVEWDETGPMQYLVTESHMTVRNIAPTMAYRVNDQFSLGVGLNVYWGDLEQKFNFSPFVPGAQTRFDADGIGVGATLGLLWKPHSQHAFALVYRSPFSIDYDGSVSISSVVSATPARAEIDYPQSIAVGYAFRPAPRLKLEVNVDWTDWDRLNTVTLRTVNPVVSADPRSTIPFNWESSFFYEFGVQYDLTDQWVLRAGYIFSENSVPTSTFSPLVPDSDRHILSVGAGFKAKRFDVGFAYQLVLGDDRAIPAFGSVGSPFVDGKWETTSHGFIVTGSLKF